MEEKKEKKEFSFKPYIGVAIFMFIIVITAYGWNFNNYPISKNSADWGTFGDFVGGTLNPTLAFLSFIALLQTIRIQSRELSNSTEELKETRKATRDSAIALKEQSDSIKVQNFENTFFNLLSLHNDIVKNIHYSKNTSFVNPNKNNSEKNYTKVIFQEKYESHNTEYIESREAIKDIVQKIDSSSNQGYHKPRVFNGFYTSCHNASQSYIGHYFGNIYQILKFISTDQNIPNKEKYANLFRAQFSSSELKLLFYHCCGAIGIKRFKEYIEEFNFFEHLVIEENNKNFKYILCNSFYKGSAFGENFNIIDKFISNTIIDTQKWLETNSIESGVSAVEFFNSCYVIGRFEPVLQILKENETDINKLMEKEIKETIYNLKTYSSKPL